MVILFFRIGHSLSHSCGECIFFRTVNTKQLVISFEVVHFFYLFQLVLELILNIHGQAAKVGINIDIKLGQLLIVSRI